jgi:hypothetical protein
MKTAIKTVADYRARMAGRPTLDEAIRNKNRSLVMKLAWKIYNETGTYTFPEALKTAWSIHNPNPAR